jgi:C-terminal processing protease CtpA/Prc
MNFKIGIILLVLVSNFVFGQNANPKNLLLNKTLNKDSITAEFITLYNLTNTVHPGQFMFCSQKEFDNTYRELKNSVKTDLSMVDYFRLTSTLMSKIKDGHTAVDRSNIIKLLKEKPIFPFSIFKIKNNYYLDKSTIENKDFKGLKILKINGESISSIIKEIEKYIHLEGRNETGINVRLRSFPFYYFIYNQAETFKIEYVDTNNTKKTLDFKGIPFENFTKSNAQNIEAISTEFKNNEIAVLKFHSFENGYDEASRKIAEKQLDVFFAKADSLKVQNLILDLRDNSGGSPDIANYLFSYLTDKPYYYFDYIGNKYNSTKDWKHLAQYPDNINEINLSETKLINGLHCYVETDSNEYWALKKQQNKSKYFKGKLRVLIDGACFSTTGHLLALLRDKNIGIFYGEHSQGSNYSNSGGQAFVLPYSKILIWIPVSQFKMRTPNFKYDSKGIEPDVEVLTQPDDLKTNFDRQMDFVLKEIKK